MSTESAVDLTQLLFACQKGDKGAIDRLVPIVYEELRRLASAYMKRERPDHTLQTSALINEAYLRLISSPVSLENRAHFFGIAARLMRQILVDHARARRSNKRGGSWRRVALSDDVQGKRDDATEIIALNDALTRLEALDPQQSRIIELRFFGGMTIEETGRTMGLSHTTVEKDWNMARAWLRKEMTRR
jgi:RNA polymerase sigma-70 factor (ECF subfamily)